MTPDEAFAADRRGAVAAELTQENILEALQDVYENIPSQPTHYDSNLAEMYRRAIMFAEGNSEEL